MADEPRKASITRAVKRLARRGARDRLLPASRAIGLEAAAARGDLAVTARTLAAGLLQGRHRTPHRGGAIEFFDFRPYSPGDPLRLVDWRLAGRTDRYYIRRYRHEAQLTVLLVLDASASMGFSGLADDPDARTKLRHAQELAAAIAHLTTRQGDRVGVLVPGANARGGMRPLVVPPGAGWPRLHEAIAALDAAEPGGDASLARALSDAPAVLRGRGLVIAIGDALEDESPLIDAVARLRAGDRANSPYSPGGGFRDVRILQVLAPDELNIDRLGAAQLFDPESSDAVRTGGPGIAADYAERINRHIATLRGRLESLGARHVLTRTDDDPVEALRRVLTTRHAG